MEGVEVEVRVEIKVIGVVEVRVVEVRVVEVRVVEVGRVRVEVMIVEVSMDVVMELRVEVMEVVVCALLSTVEMCVAVRVIRVPMEVPALYSPHDSRQDQDQRRGTSGSMKK